MESKLYFYLPVTAKNVILKDNPCNSMLCTVLSHPFMSDSVQPHGLARQAPLSTGFSRQEYWSGLPRTSPGDLPDELLSPESQADSSWPRNWTQLSHIADGFFTIWATREAQEYWRG